MQKSLEQVFGKEAYDNRSLKFLLNAIEKGNQPGFDYLEFKESLYNLMILNVEHTTAVKSAFATASTIGITKNKLVESASFYKSLLVKERQKFDEAFQNQVSSKIEAKKLEIERLKKEVEKFKAQVIELERKISNADITINNADANIKTEQDRISATKINFEKTFEEITFDIDKDIEVIRKNL